MGLVHLDDASRERARIDDEPHGFPRRLHGRIGHRVTETGVVDDDVHSGDAIACGAYPLDGDSRRTARPVAWRPGRRGEKLAPTAITRSALSVLILASGEVVGRDCDAC